MWISKGARPTDVLWLLLRRGAFAGGLATKHPADLGEFAPDNSRVLVMEERPVARGPEVEAVA